MQLSKVGAQLFVGEFNSAANFLQLSNILILMIGLLVPFFYVYFTILLLFSVLYRRLRFKLFDFGLLPLLQNQLLRHQVWRTSGVLRVTERDFWMNVNYDGERLLMLFL